MFAQLLNLLAHSITTFQQEFVIWKMEISALIQIQLIIHIHPQVTGQKYLLTWQIVLQHLSSSE